jgi:hypothetical protein
LNPDLIGNVEKIDFYLGLQDVLAGVENWHERMLAFLSRLQTDDPLSEARRKRLVAAYEQVPFQPARDFFEALV